MEIELTLINRSNDADESHIVIFQKNAAPGAASQVVAWRVVHGLQKEYPYTIMFPTSLQLAAADSYGDSTPQRDVEAGQLGVVVMDASGLELQVDAGANPLEIVVRNGLSNGPITATLYRDYMPIVKQTGISLGIEATFEFKPSIWIGVVSQIEEGDIMDAAIVNTVNTELSLMGINNANIIMSGGGAEPFRFTLEAAV